MDNRLCSSQSQELVVDVEVWTAVESLSDAATRRLEKSANWRFRGLPHAKRFGRSPEDLLREVIYLTLRGRRWDKAIPFEAHLRRLMRSVVSQWRRKKKEPNHVLGRPWDKENGECGEFERQEAPLQRTPSPDPNAERILEARQLLTQVKERIADIPDALRICELVAQDWTVSEIGHELGMPVRKIETVLKRIRYRVRKLVERGEL